MTVQAALAHLVSVLAASGGEVELGEVELGDVQHSGALTGSSWSFNTHDLAADDDLVLILWNVWSASSGIQTPTGVTYGGVAATPLAAYGVDSATSGQDFVAGAAYILAGALPSPGANKTCAVNWGVVRRGSICCIGLKGAAQTAPQHNGAGVEGTTQIGPTSVTVSAGAALLQSFIKDDVDVPTQGDGETLIARFEETIGGNYCLFSYKLNASGSASMSTSWSTNENAAHIVVGVNPA